MTKTIKLKTTRTKSGYAKARLSRFMNFTNNKLCYTFSFYNVWKSFEKHNELRAYISETYDVDIGERKNFWF